MKKQKFHPIGWMIQVRMNVADPWQEWDHEIRATEQGAKKRYNLFQSEMGFVAKERRGLARVVRVGYME